MSTSQKPWSYTALTSFETCPRKFYETRVAKTVVEPPTEALTWGNNVHKALELRAKESKPLPTGMTQWEQLMEKLIATDGWTLVESQYALTDNFEPVDWFGSNVWLRCVIDFGKLRDKSILALDYKTGKVKHDIDQLRLFAAVLMELYHTVDRVVTGYVWLKDKKITKETFTREQKAGIWGGFIPRVNRFQEAHRTGSWPEKPSGLCRAWCPVTKCQFNGRG